MLHTRRGGLFPDFTGQQSIYIYLFSCPRNLQPTWELPLLIFPELFMNQGENIRK